MPPSGNLPTRILGRRGQLVPLWGVSHHLRLVGRARLCYAARASRETCLNETYRRRRPQAVRSFQLYTAGPNGDNFGATHFEKRNVGQDAMRQHVHMGLAAMVRLPVPG